MLSLADLVAPKTRDEMLQVLLDRLSGRGRITHVGTGTGTFLFTGSPTAAHSVVIEIVADVGTEVDVNVYVDGALNDGIGWGKDVAGTDPVLPGVEITASGTFVAGDTYSFALTAPNFPATSWQIGSVPRSLLEAEADALSDLSQLIANIASGGELDTASGDWLTLLAAQRYGLTRTPATPTLCWLRLTGASGSSPQTIAVGQLWAKSNGATGSILKYTNVSGGTLLAGPSTLDMLFLAERPGAIFNAPAVGTVNALVTPLPGVTVANPADWLSRAQAIVGTDEESDVLLRQRCRDRWPALGIGDPAAKYRLWARTAAPSVTRVLVAPSSTVPGRVDVTLAGANGSVLSGGVVSAVDAFIRARIFETDVLVAAAAAHAIPVSGIVYVEAAKLATVQAAALAALNGYFNTSPIGGFATPLSSHVISVEKVYGLITDRDGVVDFAPTAPLADVVLAANEIPAQDLSGLSFVGV